MSKKVVVGMSGGVDSSVAAYLLKKQGYDVIGATIRTWRIDGSAADEDAKIICEQLGIEYHIVDAVEHFRHSIVDPFVEAYYEAMTPNPCVLCNPRIKWGCLLELADAMGAEYIATGHYGHIYQLENGRYTIEQSMGGKDQSYAISGLTQEQLARTMMPLGDYTKDQVRAIAQEQNLAVAHKADSQEICFVPKDDYGAFLEAYSHKNSEPGHYIDCDGHVLGEHKGLIHYTIGQRKGLGISLGHPVFVTELRPETNEVVLGSNEDCFRFGLVADQLNWMMVEDLETPVSVTGKIRYLHRPAACVIEKMGDGRVYCRFAEKQRAITPGQTVVWYKDGMVFGSGRVVKVCE